MLKEFIPLFGEIIREPFRALIKEIQDYFKILPKIRKSEIGQKLQKHKDETLVNLGLIEKNLSDPLYLPEILTFSEEIKELNFDEFPSGWNTHGYYHHDRGYVFKDLLFDLYPYSEIIEKIRSKVPVNRGLQSKKEFISTSFEDYGLEIFKGVKSQINKIAYDKYLFKILPVLLRQLFENLLWYVFKDGLSRELTFLYYNTHKARIRDFSELISLLNYFKDNEFIPYSKNRINTSIIEDLKELKKFGNWTIHDIHDHLGTDFADTWKLKVNKLIETISILYKEIKGKNILIQEKGRFRRVMDKLGIKQEIKKDTHNSEKQVKKKKNIQKNKDMVRIIEISEEEISKRQRFWLDDTSDETSKEDLILFGFNVYPFENEWPQLDTDSEEIEIFLKDLESKFIIKDPTGLLVYFSEFLKNFSFHQGIYTYDFTTNLATYLNISQIMVSPNATISSTLIFQTIPAKDVMANMFLFTDREKLKTNEASILPAELFVYLIMIWLKLIHMIYKKLDFNKGVKVYLNLISINKLALLNQKSCDLSSYDKIYFSKNFDIEDLNKESSFKSVLNEFLKTFLRQFGFSLTEIKTKIKIFDTTIDKYLEYILRD